MSVLRGGINSLAVAVALTACGPGEFQRTMGEPVEAACVGESEPLLVPIGAIPINPQDEQPDEMRAAMQRNSSRFLSDMGEPSLWCGPQPDEAYRLMLSSAWGDSLAIRVTRIGDRITLIAVSASRRVGSQPPTINRSISRDLSSREWSDLKQALDGVHFWRTTTSMSDLIGNDGSMWAIEGQREGRYHRVMRFIGRDGVREVGLKFIQLAGLTDQFGSTP